MASHRDGTRDRRAHRRSNGPFIELHLGNQDDWNAKAVFVRHNGIHSISPPKNMDDDEEDT